MPFATGRSEQLIRFNYERYLARLDQILIFAWSGFLVATILIVLGFEF